MVDNVTVEVAYATPTKQKVISLQVQKNSTVSQAILKSNIFDAFSELKKNYEENFSALQVGIFSKPCSLEQEIQAGDRIEIYRILQNDPKEMRRSRANNTKS